MRNITVRDLKILIDQLRGETVVLLPGSDHSFRQAGATVALARLHPRHGWSEDDGEETITNELGTRQRVVIIQ